MRVEVAMMTINTPLILIPKSTNGLGEVRKRLLDRFQTDYDPNSRKYLIKNRGNFDFYLGRPQDWLTCLSEGFIAAVTGSDILMEELLSRGQDYDMEFRSSRLNLGGGRILLSLLPGRKLGNGLSLVVPPGYTNITRKYLREEGIDEYRLIKISGSTEGYPRLFGADGVVDISSSGNSLRDNGYDPEESRLLMETNGMVVYRPQFDNLVSYIFDSMLKKGEEE
jgi:ATP phosphoribosyltransferase